MTYITGDTHGRFGRIKEFCNEQKTSKEDVMIILGDVGINYYLDKRDDYLREEAAKLPITLFGIHGNHEERPYNIEGYEEAEAYGGKVFINPNYPNQIFAKDGEIYKFGEKEVIVIGGAYSVGKFMRIKKHKPWFESEQPDDKIKADVERALDNHNWKVDVVFSHTCPYDYIPRELFLSYVDQSRVDYATEKWLQKIEDRLEYTDWYFGHFHGEYRKDRLRCMNKEIEEFE